MVFTPVDIMNPWADNPNCQTPVSESKLHPDQSPSTQVRIQSSSSSDILWECLQMTPLEKRKLFGKVAFHCVVLTCVLWSLYVLIERTVEELERGTLEWPFWTKLTVVAFGLFGVTVFMYIQCKVYISLCRRWRAFNRVIYIENAPEKPALPPDSTAGISTVCNTSLVKPSDCVVGIPQVATVSPPPPQSASHDPETYALLNA